MQRNKKKSQKKIARSIRIIKINFILWMSILICTPSINAQFNHLISEKISDNNEKSIIWDATMSFTNTGGQNDYIMFGEAPDANDGPPADIYDTVKPPAPIPPYIRTWLNDNLPMPYDSLWMDYRHYPSTSKTWNLTVHWMPSSGSSPTTITMNWNIAEVSQSEYTNITLCTNEGTPLKNMLTSNSYVFSCPAFVPQFFKIICLSENLPPVAVDDTAAVNEDSSNNQINVLSNDYDPEGENLTILSVTQPSHGTSSTNEAYCYYTPTTHYHGSDSFTYTISDPFGGVDTATVSITVQAKPYYLTITIQGSGTVIKNPDQPSYTYGQVVTITANPSSGWVFNHWDGDLQGNTNPTTITMDEDKSVIANFTLSNQPPNKPSTPTGPTSGKPGAIYTYSTSTTDPNGDQVYYMWDWGDGTSLTWLGPFNSDASMNTTHTWGKGSFSIKVKAKDSFGAESAWSDPLTVSMPFSKDYISSLFEQIITFLIQIIQNHSGVHLLNFLLNMEVYY